MYLGSKSNQCNVFTACPSRCQQCTWNAASGQLVCNALQCDSGYTQDPNTYSCLR